MKVKGPRRDSGSVSGGRTGRGWVAEGLDRLLWPRFGPGWAVDRCEFAVFGRAGLAPAAGGVSGAAVEGLGCRVGAS
jgi:hypothetical protein